MMKRKFGELSPWPSAPELTANAEFDPSLPEHWPLWARLKINDQELSQPTTDDVEFLIHGFHETHPRTDEEDRYQRFCLTFDGYWWSKQQSHNANESISVLEATAQRVRMIAAGTADDHSIAGDAITRMTRSCSPAEIRASMFLFQRSYRHKGVGPDSSLLSSYPLLREMAQALLNILRSGRTAS
jgi:hypothetical protein